MQMLQCRFCMGKKACEDGGRKGINRKGVVTLVELR